MHEVGSALEGKLLYTLSLRIQIQDGMKRMEISRGETMMFYINSINISVGPVQPLCLWILLNSKKPTNFFLKFRFCDKLVQFTISFLFDSIGFSFTKELTDPDAPCMEYLPTFTPKMAQFCKQIYQHHGAYG